MNQMMMWMERTMGMPGMVGGMSPGMMMGAGSMNMMMIPRCTMKMEKCNGGMRMSCVCKDETAAAMLQNLCMMMNGSMVSCCMMMNGMMMMCCNMTMGLCKIEPMQNGVTMTWTSKDEQTCRMIQSCCDTMMMMMDCGCTCCMCMNAMPVCCGTCC